MTSQTYRSLVFTDHNSPLTIRTSPLPSSAPQGTAIVRVLAAYIHPYLKAVLSGSLPYVLSPPFTPSSSCIARIHAVGPDATVLRPGQLVLCDLTLRARDDPATMVLQGLHGGSAPSLMREWKDGSYGEYAVFPLENVFALNEALLCGRMGYSVEDLSLIRLCNVPFGGLADLDVKPGETVVVCPATGKFGGAAVLTALALGARVVAAARNRDALERLVAPWRETGRASIVVMSGEAEADTKALKEAAGGVGADCYVDFSPPQAATSTHISACLSALRPFGRAVFNGGSAGNVTIPYLQLMINSLQLRGRFMYEREHTVRLIKMVEAGLLPLGEKVGFRTAARFGLDQIEEAMDVAEKESGWGTQVLLVP